MQIDWDSLKGRIICIEGCIGAGKSVLCDALYDLLFENNINCKVFPEYVNLTFLNMYIREPSKYAFSFQMFMLAKRIETYTLAGYYAAQDYCVILDRSLLGDMAFANLHKVNGNLTEEEWKAYYTTAQTESKIKSLNIIYLDCSAETCMQRIKKRNREGENGYTKDYLLSVIYSYKELMEKFKKNITPIDWNKNRDITKETAFEVITQVYLDIVYEQYQQYIGLDTFIKSH